MKTIAPFISLLFLSLTFVAPTPAGAAFSSDTNLPNAPESEFVRRATLTTNIVDREPVDNLNNQQVPSDLSKIFFFTEIVNKTDQMVTHRWFLNGRLEAEVVLKIGSARWRTYSSKNLVEAHRGTWQVEVVDQSNRLLATQTFTY